MINLIDLYFFGGVAGVVLAFTWTKMEVKQLRRDMDKVRQKLEQLDK